MNRLTVRLGATLVALTTAAAPFLISTSAARADVVLLVQAVDAPPGDPGAGVVTVSWGLNKSLYSYTTASVVVYGQPGDLPPAVGAGTVLFSANSDPGTAALPTVTGATSWAFRVVDTIDGTSFTGTAVLHRVHLVVHYDPLAKFNNTSVHVTLDDGTPAVSGSVGYVCGHTKSYPTPFEVSDHGKLVFNSPSVPGRCTLNFTGSGAYPANFGPAVVGSFAASASYVVTVPYKFFMANLLEVFVSPGQRVTWHWLLTPALKGTPVQIQVISKGNWKTIQVVKAGKPNKNHQSPFQATLTIPRSAHRDFKVRTLVVGKHGYLTSSQVLDAPVLG